MLVIGCLVTLRDLLYNERVSKDNYCIEKLTGLCLTSLGASWNSKWSSWHYADAH